MKNIDTDIEKLIAEGVAPPWVRPKNPERLAALLTVVETRQLTEAEVQELYEAADGEPPPAEDQARFTSAVLGKINEEEKEEVILGHILASVLEFRGHNTDSGKLGNLQ